MLTEVPCANLLRPLEFSMSPAILTSLDQSGLQEFPKPSIEILELATLGGEINAEATILTNLFIITEGWPCQITVSILLLMN